MKRARELVWLSRQHHTALVIARGVQRLDFADGEAVRQLVARILDNFDTELAAHFRFEESRLLPLLEAAGEGERVRRTLADHAELRQLIGRLRAGDAGSLRRYGELLNAHTRFEDRDLFVVAESVLSPEILASLDEPDVHQR